MQHMRFKWCSCISSRVSAVDTSSGLCYSRQSVAPALPSLQDVQRTEYVAGTQADELRATRHAQADQDRHYMDDLLHVERQLLER